MALHWIVALIAILPMWFLQNIIHELAHGLTLWFGWRWKFRIFPFPSKKLGRFTWAHVRYIRTSASTDPSDGGMALVSIMPKLVNIVFIYGALIAAILAPSPILLLLLLMFALFNLVDFSVGVAGIFRSKPNSSDIWNYQQRSRMPVGHLRFAAVALFLILFITVGSVGLLSLKGLL
jgi:hypothetical protein